MKQKNLILGVIAFVSALCCAFTSVQSPILEAAYVRVKLNTIDAWNCRISYSNCDTSGPYQCNVAIFTNSSGTTNVAARTATCQHYTNYTATPIANTFLRSGAIPWEAQ
jgi:hypothetical protein